MTTFDEAARKAAEAVMQIAKDNDIYNTDVGRESEIFEKITVRMETCITKHYADLEETYDKLTKLAFIVLQAEIAQREIEAMIDPAIAALLAGKKG